MSVVIQDGGPDMAPMLPQRLGSAPAEPWRSSGRG
jgi:hypothetical protein